MGLHEGHAELEMGKRRHDLEGVSTSSDDHELVSGLKTKVSFLRVLDCRLDCASFPRAFPPPPDENK
jgi:hypothetical protein